MRARSPCGRPLFILSPESGPLDSGPIRLCPSAPKQSKRTDQYETCQNRLLRRRRRRDFPRRFLLLQLPGSRSDQPDLRRAGQVSGPARDPIRATV